MSSRTPQPPSVAEAEGIPDSGAVTPEQAAAGETVDYGNGTESPRDVPLGVDEFGTTAAEQREGEGLDRRIAREEPEVTLGADDLGGDQRAGQGVGRIVEPDEGARTDAEKDVIATDVGTDLGGYSAEESAMHLEPEA